PPLRPRQCVAVRRGAIRHRITCRPGPPGPPTATGPGGAPAALRRIGRDASRPDRRFREGRLGREEEGDPRREAGGGPDGRAASGTGGAEADTRPSRSGARSGPARLRAGTATAWTCPGPSVRSRRWNSGPGPSALSADSADEENT